jgi:glycerate kinase
MEMAEASGLLLVPEEKRNPWLTSTFGTGEMMARALDRGDRHIYIGIGGSATCDGGMGAMEALGVRFLDRDGNPLPGRGSSLGKVEAIDLSGIHEGVKNMDLTILGDVTNPLCGNRGAARVFGPQKGADPAMVEALEMGMVHYGKILEKTFGMDLEHLAGGGAAGGLGAALLLFLHGTMASGAEKVLELARFDQRLETADLVITGEGRTDGQSGEGKITGRIAAHCKKKGGSLCRPLRIFGRRMGEPPFPGGCGGPSGSGRGGYPEIHEGAESLVPECGRAVLKGKI